METRSPVVAGQFYPGRANACTAEIEQCLQEIPVPESLPETIVAGIAPHAGWTFSGAPAALVFAAVKKRHENVETFCLFGATHGYFGRKPAVYDKGSWATPLGDVPIDEDLAAAVVKSETAVSDAHAHTGEHSIEVQIPFIKHLFPEAKILPILTPPDEGAVELGRAVGEIIAAEPGRKIVCIGSTDLTHYGPRYGFTPMGVGADACKWASEVNDKQFIDLALKLEPEKMLSNAAENYSACGAGAAAATVAAAKQLGKTEGLLLAHTNSNQVMLKKMGASSAESVGYAAIIF
jgi:AmmeMemoRadiSam system protein B